MKIFHQHGSKERLFEMMKRVNLLNEDLLPINDRYEIINDFVQFACNHLEISEEPKIMLISDNDAAKSMKSYGRYVPDSGEISVVLANRGLADILRTIAHELVHHKQRSEDRLDPNSGETGSEIENEANAVAGVIMREYGKNNPEIFE